MKISLAWIEELLGTRLEKSPKEISEILGRLGFEVEGISYYQGPTGITVADVLEVSKHPNADKLRLAKITDGKETTTVVCGAPNLAVGQRIFWAKIGSVLADGTTIKETPIRGIKSPGMLCSARELGVGEDHSGLWILPETISVGQGLEDVVKLEDHILDLGVTPNRPDGLSQMGIAREIAANLSLKGPSLSIPLAMDHHSLPYYSVDIQHADCLRYIARKIDGVTVVPSPLAMQARLIRCGIRPISNLVDITNWVLLETGQPLHAFDADKLEGGKIIVRRAKPGEKILALDGKTYDLDPEILVIADQRKPVAIAGIMGGQDTAVSADTKNVLLESAVFNQRTVRAGRKKLNLASESSYRFERGVSQWSCETGSARAEAMILQFTKGHTVSFSDQPKISKDAPHGGIMVRVPQVERILGEKIPLSEIQGIFQKLGITILSASEEKLAVQGAEWRLDLNQEIDFIEEIARMRGYDKTPSKGREAHLPESMGQLESAQLRGKVKSAMLSYGFSEALNYGLISQKAARYFLDESLWLKLENPLSEDQVVLRPSLIPDLFKNLNLNLSYQKKDLRLFEIGSVFHKFEAEPPQNAILAGVATGFLTGSNWQIKEPHKADFFWMKGVVQNLLKSFRIESQINPAKPQKVPSRYADRDESPYIADHASFLHPSFAFSIDAFGKKAGYFGRVHPKIARWFDIPEETVLFELDLSIFERNFRKNYAKIVAPSRTPAIARDCSVWVGENVAWKDLESEILRKNQEGIQTRCELFDVYKDPAKPAQQSLTFTLTFSHPEKTLDDNTANQTRDKILDNLNKKFKTELRGK